MSEPTEAEIEAAAQVMRREITSSVRPWNNLDDGQKHLWCRRAKLVLEAAARVRAEKAEAMVRTAIDVAWGYALEDGSVPSTAIQDKIIARVRASPPPQPEAEHK